MGGVGNGVDAVAGTDHRSLPGTEGDSDPRIHQHRLEADETIGIAGLAGSDYRNGITRDHLAQGFVAGDHHLSVGQIEVVPAVVLFIRRAVVLESDSQVESQVRANLPVVLNEEAELPVPGLGSGGDGLDLGGERQASKRSPKS